MSKILLLGNPPENDVTLLKNMSTNYGFEIEILSETNINSFDFGKNKTIACISYLKCTQENILGMFGAIPLGFGHEIPLFQLIENNDCPKFCEDLPFFGFFSSPLSYLDCKNILTAIKNCKISSLHNKEMMSEIIKYRKQKHQLIKIGSSLSMLNDLDKLLTLFLSESRDVTCADAGSIYIREKKEPGGFFSNSLRFKISQNDSIDISDKITEFSIPINKYSVAGYVAESGETLLIEDFQSIDDSTSYKQKRKEYEIKFDYPVKSMLTVPLKNKNNEIVGVLQLMNKKIDSSYILKNKEDLEKYVVPFTISDEDFVLSIASIAAVSIERAQLYKEIQDIFEGYLKSSIAAIDERDRVTYGHSRRVMGYAMAFIDAINKTQEGPFANIHFTEDQRNQFRFAALLHDIGKIGVPEALLTKEYKISKEGIEIIKLRGKYIKLILKTQNASNKTSWKTYEEIDADIEFILKINKSGFLNDNDFSHLREINKKFYYDINGNKMPFLLPHEFECLSVRKGNLTEKERERINSHAIATRRILSRIPWIKGLERIPEIASHHHERLDGSGYPDGLTKNELSLESKILAVIDIYEALVAQDRPYKPKMPPQKAIEILREEARLNHLDSEIVEFFISNGIYKTFMEEQALNVENPK